jgi:phosphate transport system substrate-binding protein
VGVDDDSSPEFFMPLRQMPMVLVMFLSCLGCNSRPGTAERSAAEESGRTGARRLSALRGEVKIDGSSTVFPISEAAASAFHEEFPGVDVTVGKKGTGGGFSEFIRGEIEIADASRPIKGEELAECLKRGIRFLELPIAYDGITICVHKENRFISEISLEDLRRIYSADVALKSWKDLKGDYPDQPFKIFMPGTDSGTFDFFREVIVGKEGSIRADVTPSEEDLVLVNGIAAEKFGIGFFGASYYFENRERVKALKVIDPKTAVAVEPSPANIEQARYAPLGRPIFLYVNSASMKRPEARRFVEYFLEHALEICQAAKCVPLSQELYATVRQRFEARLAGSFFYDEQGNARRGRLAEIYVEENLIAIP